MNYALPLLTLLPAGLMACSLGAPAQAAPVSQALPAARALSLSGAFTTELTIGDQPRLIIHGPADAVIVDATEDRISISRRSKLSGEIKLTIVLAGLEALDLSGAQNLRASGLDGARLKLDASGASKVELAGTYDRLDVDLSGASRLDASKLSAKVVDLGTSGVANVDVSADERLRVRASGASKVRYSGGAVVEKDVSGVASVLKI